MKTPSDFYAEASRGKNTAIVWISAISIILTSFYFITGAFSGIVTSVVGFFGGIWNPDYYSENSPRRWKYFWSVFYGWTSGAIFGLAGLYFVQTKLRERPFLKLLTSAPKFRFKRLLGAAGICFLLKIVFLFLQSVYLGNADIPVWSEPQAIPGFAIERTSLSVLTYLLIAPFLVGLIILFIIFQEALFRGFIDQGLTCKFKQTLPAFIFSAALFSLWHIWSYDTYFGAGSFLLGIFIIGLTMSILSSNDEGLEAAIGVQLMSSIFFNLGIGTSITLLPITTLWTLGEPEFKAGHVFETLLMCISLIAILKFWRFGVSENGNK